MAANAACLGARGPAKLEGCLSHYRRPDVLQRTAKSNQQFWSELQRKMTMNAACGSRQKKGVSGLSLRNRRSLLVITLSPFVLHNRYFFGVYSSQARQRILIRLKECFFSTVGDFFPELH